MHLLKKLAFILFSLAFPLSMQAAEFEGSLIITKITLYDTVLFHFRVAENQIRIDQKNTMNETIQTLLIDLNTEKITALSPNYKLYTQIQKQNSTQHSNKQKRIIPSENFKYINGYKCYQWRVRYEDSEVSYWVMNTGYTFFSKALYLLNTTSEYANLLGSFPDLESTGYIPILSEERTLLREVKSNIKITQISANPIDPRIFEIPKNYKFLRY